MCFKRTDLETPGTSLARLCGVETSLRPYFRRRYLLSNAERSFHEVLRRILGDYVVLAKVRLADLVHIRRNARPRRAHFNRVCSKHIDFVVCDAHLSPIIAVELDDASHLREDRKLRDATVDEILDAAKLPLVRIQARRGYALDEVRRSLLAKLEANW